MSLVHADNASSPTGRVWPPKVPDDVSRRLEVTSMLVADVNGGAGIYGFSYVGKRRARDEINAANGTDTYNPVLTIGTSAGAIDSFADACGGTTEELEQLMPTISWSQADPTRGFLQKIGVAGEVVAFAWDVLRDGFLNTDVLTAKIAGLGEHFGVRTFRDLLAKQAAGAPEFHCFVYDASTNTGFSVPDDITDQLGIPRETSVDAAGHTTIGWLDMPVADFVAASASATPGFSPKKLIDSQGRVHKCTDGGAWASLPMLSAEEVVDEWMTRHPGSERPLIIGATPFSIQGDYQAPRGGIIYKLFPGLDTLLDIAQAGNSAQNEYMQQPEVRGRIAVFNTSNVKLSALDLMVGIKAQRTLEADGYAGFKAWDAGRRAQSLAPYSQPQKAAPGGPGDLSVA